MSPGVPKDDEKAGDSGPLESPFTCRRAGGGFQGRYLWFRQVPRWACVPDGMVPSPPVLTSEDHKPLHPGWRGEDPRSTYLGARGNEGLSCEAGWGSGG